MHRNEVEMSLIRQVWLLLFTVLLIAVGGAVVVNLVSARDTLQAQVRLMNADNAQALALALSQQAGDPVRLQLLLSAQADTGHYRLVRFVPADGTPAFERRFDPGAGDAPGWFLALLPISAEPGVAQVSDGWRSLGRVELESSTEHAYASLWRGGWRAALWMAMVGVVAALLAQRGVRRLQGPIADTVRQAQSLSEGAYVVVDEPDVPELRRMSAAMNTMVQRVRQLFELQAEDSERWRRQAHCDALTGLPHRSHFLDRVQVLLQREDGAEQGGLVMLRLADLDNLNRRLGRATVDSALRSVAALLQTYTDRAPDCVAGRLNGADFALFLPVAGLASETAASMAAGLRSALAAHHQELSAHLGAVELRREVPVGQWMAQADLALASAELGEPFSLTVLTHPMPAPGEGVWREQLQSALDSGRSQLAEYPVIDARGALLHLECPLRLRLEAGSDALPAARWLPLAVRTRLTQAVDLEAVRLALEAIARDGVPRSVNIASASLADHDFLARLTDRIQAQPPAAGGLWLEVGERAAQERFRAVQALCRQVRPLGVRVGLEHAGVHLHRIERLYELGLDFVKLDAAFCTGLAHQPAAQDFMRGCVRLLVGLGVQVLAEGVQDEADASALWDCGVQALTGPWASAQGPG